MFDFNTSIRKRAPRDINITIDLRVYQDGVRVGKYDHEYQVVFRKDSDELFVSCPIYDLEPGNFETQVPGVGRRIR